MTYKEGTKIKIVLKGTSWSSYFMDDHKKTDGIWILTKPWRPDEDDYIKISPAIFSLGGRIWEHNTGRDYSEIIVLECNELPEELFKI